ncbi:hypothetical protein [Bacillus taeanensis]|uniref:Uncharacterized protein n=1 Tax=Bacillus taeanensis TaxID=273032 RepID=A0A366XYV7_9BACI|nr:hypothetical protein [Bacillus taeanensis]RBW69939.1 hypothetical protein DS031_08765 [Bacillus taeanensis]
MGAFFGDLTLLAIFIIGSTAFLGMISFGIGRIFKGKKGDESFLKSTDLQGGWISVDRRRS